MLAKPAIDPIRPIILPRSSGGVQSATRACQTGPPMGPQTVPPNPWATPPMDLVRVSCQKLLDSMKPIVEIGPRVLETMMQGLRPMRSERIPPGMVRAVEMMLTIVPMRPHWVLVRPISSTA